MVLLPNQPDAESPGTWDTLISDNGLAARIRGFAVVIATYLCSPWLGKECSIVLAAAEYLSIGLSILPGVLCSSREGRARRRSVSLDVHHADQRFHLSARIFLPAWCI